MDRILKKYTTIPTHLYVERGADLQLKKIIEDMQRPGYVLVARQMGKTNLLINAKRSLENEKRLFAYVDLSNLYDNERDCYRNIINNIIELNLTIFEQIEDKIIEVRNKNLPAHNEYLRSLILILKNYSGDLIIILDEIDALKSVEYSDNIFAQIRSNYFSRTNFDVLERLTYVLSGVIEPTELIKDKNKSPFNIGDKIYLDDFTKEEHNTFIYKSKLRVSNQISKEIYEWTSGNPRLTFDICSELEILIIQGIEINSDILDNLIRKKYLTTFDLAPIDHIRELVKENTYIRESIKNIYLGQYELINHDIKSKLYLYGIINSKFQEKTEIKNKIIRETLNEEWLKSLDIEKTFFAGLSKYFNGNLEEAIEIFEYVIKSSLDNSEIEKSRYYLGLCYYDLENYSEAIIYFNFDYKNNSIKNDSIAYYGISLLKSEDKLGLEILENFVSIEQNHNYPYHLALLNLAINIEEEDKALSLLDKLIASTNLSSDSVDQLNASRALAYFYQSNIYEFQNNFATAIEKLDESLRYAKTEDRPILLYYKLLLKAKVQQPLINIKNELVKSIVEEKIKLSSRSDYPLIFDSEGIKEILSTVFDLTDTNPFVRLLEYLYSNLFKNKKDFIDLVIKACQISDANSIGMAIFVKDFYNQDLSTKQYVEILRLITNSEENDSEYFSSFIQYYSFLEDNTEYNLEEEDLGTLIHTIQKYTSNREFINAANICDFTENKIEKSNNDLLKSYLTYIAFWRTNIFFMQGNKNETLKSAHHTLTIVNNIENHKNHTLDASTITTIKQNINRIIEQVSKKPLSFNNNLKSLGNQIVKVRYGNGKISERKFKHVENDIKLGKCIIITDT